MADTPNFQFVLDVDGFAADVPDFAKLPSGIDNKQQLMQALVKAIPLPDYFGGNWDALDECLRDRLTDESGEPLCLLHRDLPMNQCEQDCQDYLLVLADTLAWSEKEASCEFRVIFPTAVERTIKLLLAPDTSS